MATADAVAVILPRLKRQTAIPIGATASRRTPIVQIMLLRTVIALAGDSPKTTWPIVTTPRAGRAGIKVRWLTRDARQMTFLIPWPSAVGQDTATEAGRRQHLTSYANIASD